MAEFRPILLDVPLSFETPRLIVRIPRVGDGKLLNAAIMESLPELKRWVGWVHPVPSVDDSEEFVRKAIGQWHMRSVISMVVEDKASGRIIGCTGLHAFDWDVRKLETGYWCRTSETRKGYMTEVTVGITKFAFEHFGAKRIEIRCDAENIPSRRIPERLGFRLEGQLEKFNQRFDDGSVGTQLVFARTDVKGMN